jgi:hypothetical protein
MRSVDVFEYLRSIDLLKEASQHDSFADHKEVLPYLSEIDSVRG